MKASIIIVLIVLMSVSCNKQKEIASDISVKDEGFVINGNIIGFEENTMLYLKDGKVIDSVAIVKGKFQLKGKVGKPTKMSLGTKFNASNYKETYKIRSFWVANGVISLEGDYKDFGFAKVTGLPIHNIANELSSLLEYNTNKGDSLMKLFNNDNEHNKRISREEQKNSAIIDSIKIQFIKENPNNYVSLSDMSFYMESFPKEELQSLYTSLDKELQETSYGTTVKEFLSIDKVLEEGDQVVALLGKTLSGEEQDLMSVVKKNKYTILNFWSSSCGFCRMQSEQYVEIYKQYKDKGLGIVTYSLDRKKDHWEKGSIKDSISWVNVSDLKGFRGITPMTYGVKGTPIRFLINQEGKIVKKDGGYRKDVAPFQDDLVALFDVSGK